VLTVKVADLVPVNVAVAVFVLEEPKKTLKNKKLYNNIPVKVNA